MERGNNWNDTTSAQFKNLVLGPPPRWEGGQAGPWGSGPPSAWRSQFSFGILKEMALKWVLGGIPKSLGGWAAPGPPGFKNNPVMNTFPFGYQGGPLGIVFPPIKESFNFIHFSGTQKLLTYKSLPLTFFGMYETYFFPSFFGLGKAFSPLGKDCTVGCWYWWLILHIQKKKKRPLLLLCFITSSISLCGIC